VDFDREMQATTISEAQAQAYMGDLLLHSHRAESESYLQKALSLDPNLAMAHASLGMLRVQQGKLDDARRSLERALAVNSDNYLIHYYYALALSRRAGDGLITAYPPDDAARMRQELKKAIALRPDFVEPCKLLAFINLVSGEEIAESVTMLKKAIAAAPGRDDLSFILVQLYIQQQDYKTSRQMLERLSHSSNEDVQRKSQSLLKHLSAIELSAGDDSVADDTTADASKTRDPATTSRGGTPGGAPQASRLTRRDSQNGQQGVVLDPYSHLQDELRHPGKDEKRIQGTLIRLDCDAKGINFVVKVGDRLMKLHTDRFESIRIAAFTNDAGREITCGPRNSENAVVVCFLPSVAGRARIDGVLKSVEFVPKEFKLDDENPD